MRKVLLGGLMAALLLAATRLPAADSLIWKANQVDADIQSQSLTRVLAQISTATGWRIYLEPGIEHEVSTKFDALPPGGALRLLLGDLNFALIPRTNSNPRLYVFRTSRASATQLIQPAGKPAKNERAKVIPNELIVRLKPGANIGDLAKRLGARVVGRIDSLNAYRLQFPGAASADAARSLLAGDSDVTSVDSNYVVTTPPSAFKLASAGMSPVQLTLNPPDSSGRVVVGLVDTAVQPLGNNLDKFLLKSISVAGDGSPDTSVPLHGTSMFENILRAASVATGGSSSLQVVSVDVYGPNPTTSTFEVAAGIAAAVNNGANVINLSLGSPADSPILHDIIQQVVAKGIPIFAAAGNDASPENFYPAAYPEVTSVTSGYQGQLASYANYGSFISLMAPGSSVVYYDNSAYLVSGTSTSTAFISGLAAGVADSKHVSVANIANALRNDAAFKFTAP